jgi:hypothetical protein
MNADFCPRSAIKQQLVARLASLLWRLRRATLIETGLFQIHAEALSRRHNKSELPAQRNLDAMEVLYRIAREPNDSKSNSTIVSAPNDSPRVPAAVALESRAIRKPDAASVFLR